MKNKYDKKHLPFGNAFAIADPLVTTFLSNLNIDVTKVTQDQDVLKKFLDRYIAWISETKNNLSLIHI